MGRALLSLPEPPNPVPIREFPKRLEKLAPNDGQEGPSPLGAPVIRD